MTREYQNNTLFPVLTEEERACLVPFGEEKRLAAGDILFREGEIADRFHIVLAGEIKVTKLVAGSEMVLTIHHEGQFTGEIALLAGGKSIATGRALGPSRVLEVPTAGLRQILAACPWLAQVILTALAQRRPEAEALAQQHEKLAALGLMAAGLAHELNNPASAAQRAAQQLQANFEKQRALSIALCHRALPQEQREALYEFQREAFERAAQPPQLDPLARSDHEDAVTEWLEAHEVTEAWNLSPTFVSVGMEQAQLESLAARIPEEALCDVLYWLEGALAVASLLQEVEQSATRISDLVRAVKAYTYMDQAPQQDLDVHEGLENTLTILGHKLRKGNITVHRDYDRSLPCITAYGSELTQVWTNILVNAIEALKGEGNLCIRTCYENDTVLVEIADDGPGIPHEIQPQIFDPFFTTKGVGEGTGMGLYISYRIIVDRHKGDIRVLSKPGDTRFQVRLPIQLPAQAVNCPDATLQESAH